MNTPLVARSTFVAHLFLLLMLCTNASAQRAGELDTSFNTEDAGVQVGGRLGPAPVNVLTTALQEDKKILIGGIFSSYGGQTRNSIARLHEDGSLDSEFNSGTGFGPGRSYYSAVETITVQADGKILAGGNFGTFNDVSRKGIVRLNADGSLDAGFDPGSGFNQRVKTIAVQADGKIIAGGEFTSYNGTPCYNIARLNPDGTLDSSFKGHTSFVGTAVKNIAIQSDEKIVVGGAFQQYNGESRAGIARLNADGSLDASFDPGEDVGGHIETLAIQADGRILMGGSMIFSAITSQTSNIVRLHADGSHDTSFAMEIKFNEFTTPWVYSIVVQTDGKIVIGGDFLRFYEENGEHAITHIARLHGDGSEDKSFNSNLFFGGIIYTLSLQADGRILVGGAFDTHGITRDYLCRLSDQGNIDPSFNYMSGFDNSVLATAIQADGKIIAGGGFLSFNKQHCTRIARLHADGTFDTSFETGTGFNRGVMALAVQEDGKIIAAGSFTNYNGINQEDIVRLNSDGSLDAGFEAEGIYNSYPKGLFLLPDGKIMAYSVMVNGEDAEKAIVRLNSDGSRDNSFSPGTDFSQGIETAAVQADGKVIVGGNFQDYKGLGINNIARLNADGSMDTSFNPGTGFSDPVSSLLIQEDGKIVVIGWFNQFNGTDRKGIARLNADGSLDTSFNPGSGFNGGLSSVSQLPSGKLLLTGQFPSYNGVERNRIARVNQDGSLDMSFDPGTGFNGWAFSSTLLTDESIVVGGMFTSYNGTARNHLIKIHAGENEVTVLTAATFRKEVLVYPNPFTSQVSVKLHQTPIGQVQVVIRDLTGRAVYREADITTHRQEFSIELDDNLPRGMYVLRISNGQENGSYRIIKH